MQEHQLTWHWLTEVHNNKIIHIKCTHNTRVYLLHHVTDIDIALSGWQCSALWNTSLLLKTNNVENVLSLWYQHDNVRVGNSYRRMTVLSLCAYMSYCVGVFTQWGRDEIYDIFQTLFLNGFSLMKMYGFRFKFPMCFQTKREAIVWIMMVCLLYIGNIASSKGQWQITFHTEAILHNYSISVECNDIRPVIHGRI